MAPAVRPTAAPAAVPGRRSAAQVGEGDDSAAKRPRLLLPNKQEPVLKGSLAAAAAEAAADTVAQAGAGAPVALEGETYVAYIKRSAGEETEPGITTILGDYVERGINHGRKVFQKVHSPEDRGVKALDVLLYYWDDRDGAKYEGWWFGNKLGGTQVWGHCKDNNRMTPPGTGWKIPWNGYVRTDFAVAPREERIAKDVRRSLQILVDKVTEAEMAADQASEEAQRLLQQATASGDSEQSLTQRLRDVEALLSPQVTTLTELEKKATDAQLAATGPFATKIAPETVKALQKLSARVRAKRESVNTAFSKAKAKRKQVEDDLLYGEQEEQDRANFENLLPEVVEKVNIAEDEVEKAAIAFDFLKATGGEDGDPDMVEQALTDTEEAARHGATAVGEAHILLRALVAKSRQFAPRTKEKAESALGELSNKLDAIRQKLAPASKARQDWDRRNVVRSIVDEVQEELVLADLEVDRAEEAALLLAADPSQECLDKARKQLKSAEACVEKAIGSYEARVEDTAGPAAEALRKELEPRTSALRSRLQEIHPKLQDGATRMKGEGYLREAREKLEEAKRALVKAEEADAAAEAALAALGDKDFRPAFEVKMRAPEAAAQLAHTVGIALKTFLQTKMLEVRRTSGEGTAAAVAGMVELQKSAEQTLARIVEVRSGAARRRRRAMLQESEARVVKAEACVKEVAQAAAIFIHGPVASGGDAAGAGGGSSSSSAPSSAAYAHVPGLLPGMTPEAVREAAAKATLKERVAVEALAEAKRSVVTRQVEAKKEISAEDAGRVAALHARVISMQADLAECRKHFGTAEQRLAARKTLEEVEGKFRETAEKVDIAVAAVDALPGDPGDDASEERRTESAAAVKAAEVGTREAQLAVRIMARSLESQTRTMGFAKEALGPLNERAKALQARLDDATDRARNLAERAFVRDVLQEARAKVAECRTRMAEATASSPGDTENMTPEKIEKVGRQTVQFERLVQAALMAQSSAKTAVAMKRLAVKRLSEVGSKVANEALDAFQGEVDEAAAKLAEMRSRLAEAKAAMLRQAK